MLRFLVATAVPVALSACSPTFDWREVPVEATGLKAVLPCKPDTAQRNIALAPGREVPVQAFGCEAGGLAFAILSADVKDPSALGSTLALWRQASLAGLRATPLNEAAFLPKGALGLQQSVQVRANGRKPDGSEVESRAAYFARGTRVYQAVVYAPRMNAEAADTFMAGLRFE